MNLFFEEKAKKFKFSENKGNSVLVPNLCRRLKRLLTMILDDDDDDDDYHCYIGVVSPTPEIET
jgi:hypothetical protein